MNYEDIMQALDDVDKEERYPDERKRQFQLEDDTYSKDKKESKLVQLNKMYGDHT